MTTDTFENKTGEFCMKGKNIAISAVLAAALILGGCSAAEPAKETTLSEETTTAKETAESSEDVTEDDGETEETKQTDTSEASEESKETSSSKDLRFIRYTELTSLIKTFIDANVPDGTGEEVPAIYEICDPTGLYENAKEGLSDNLSYALHDIDGDGIEELFVIYDIVYSNGSIDDAVHDTEVLAVFTVDNEGNYTGIASGWVRNRLQFLKDGRFYRYGMGAADTIVIEYQEYVPDSKKVVSTETYFTDGTRDTDGELVMFKAKDPQLPAFGLGTDENMGPFEEPDIAGDLFQFDNVIAFSEYYS